MIPRYKLVGDYALYYDGQDLPPQRPWEFRCTLRAFDEYDAIVMSLFTIEDGIRYDVHATMPNSPDLTPQQLQSSERTMRMALAERVRAAHG